MKWKKKATLGVFILCAVTIVLCRFYANVQDKHWNEASGAVETAYAKTILTKAAKVESFYGDEPYKIIYGEDKIGQKVLVWVSSNNEVHTEMASEGYTEAQVREAMLEKGGNLQLERVLPGKLGEVYVWEVFYKKKDDSGTRYFYDYYNFKDGTYIDTYRLSLQ